MVERMSLLRRVQHLVAHAVEQPFAVDYAADSTALLRTGK